MDLSHVVRGFERAESQHIILGAPPPQSPLSSTQHRLFCAQQAWAWSLTVSPPSSHHSFTTWLLSLDPWPVLSHTCKAVLASCLISGHTLSLFFFISLFDSGPFCPFAHRYPELQIQKSSSKRIESREKAMQSTLVWGFGLVGVKGALCMAHPHFLEFFFKAGDHTSVKVRYSFVLLYLFIAYSGIISRGRQLPWHDFRTPSHPGETSA